MTRVEKLELALRNYNAVARKFIDKVDNRRARSVETYNELKSAHVFAEDALNSSPSDGRGRVPGGRR